MQNKPRFLISSDCALCLTFGEEISEQINGRIQALCLLLEQKQLPEIVELVPAYASLTIHYRPELIGYEAFCRKLEAVLDEATQTAAPPSELVRIPVCYGGDYGPDLPFVAQFNRLTPEQVIRRHSAPEYLIYMLGFSPGFPYLGGMDKSIAAPRLPAPRTKVPAGSVGIAGQSTGIYPVQSPGGWQLIGRTPLKLYDPRRDKPILLAAGQKIRFYPIGPEEFERISAREEERF